MNNYFSTSLKCSPLLPVDSTAPLRPDFQWTAGHCYFLCPPVPNDNRKASIQQRLELFSTQKQSWSVTQATVFLTQACITNHAGFQSILTPLA